MVKVIICLARKFVVVFYESICFFNNCSLFLYILYGFFIFEYRRFTCRKSILLPLLGDSSLLRLFLAKRRHEKPYFCVFCNLPIVTIIHNGRGGHNPSTTKTKSPPKPSKSPIKIGFEGFWQLHQATINPANDKKTRPSRPKATPVNIEKSLENSHILAEKCRNYHIEMW